MSNTVVMIADYNVLGSGYKSVAIGIGNTLCERGHKVVLLGANYNGREHYNPFSIVPIKGTSSVDEIWGMLKNMQELSYSDVLILADIPVVNRITERCGSLETNFSALFPLEAPPLNNSNAVKLMTLKERFLMTRFGQKALAEKFVPSTFVPLPVSDTFVPQAPFGDRESQRETIGLTKFTWLTVAENQERKNLSAAAAIISHLHDVQWVLVTRTKASSGWNIDDLLDDFDIRDKTLVIEKGMPEKTLCELYHCADGLLSTSKAEGLAIPVLESMACGTPVVAPRHTSYEEHLSDGRGVLFENAFQYVDPFGNQNRYFANVVDGVRACNELMNMTADQREDIIMHGIEYMSNRSWDFVGGLVCQQLGL